MERGYPECARHRRLAGGYQLNCVCWLGACPRLAQACEFDDDTLVGPRTPDLFAAVPCGELGAVVERHKPQTWHAMHWRTACELYGLPDCEPKTKWLFNSGHELLV